MALGRADFNHIVGAKSRITCASGARSLAELEADCGRIDAAFRSAKMGSKRRR